MKTTMDRRDTMACCFALAALLYACAGCDAEGLGDSPADTTPSLGAPQRGASTLPVGTGGQTSQATSTTLPGTGGQMGTGGQVGTGGSVATVVYKNSLTFGTGLSSTGSDLVSVGSTFSTGQIYFRLESTDDMAGRAVRIAINGGAYSQKDYANPQASGHTLLSSFSITDVGTFTIDGSLVGSSQETDIASALVTITK